VVDAFGLFLEGREPGSVGMVGHATTIATNALFGQLDLELPTTALITTRGFRDVVEIGRQRRAEVYNLFFERPPMLVERRHRYEVEERVDHGGNVLVALDHGELDEAIDEIERAGIESISIGLINSYANPVHEEEVAERVRERLPDVYISSSSVISTGYREYERFSTAVVNAALIPIIHSYVSSLSVDLRDLGVEAPLYVMQSNGGMADAGVVAGKPVTIVESGPASGVIAASWLGEVMGVRDVISFDMGGTTAKAGTVRGRVPEVVPEYEVAGKVHMGRLLKGSGYPVRFPFIDLAECSAGGGTIAWADEGGALRVGPTSAGADPGPACYGKKGGEPTITDANMALGRLNPEALLDGGMKVYPRLARVALSKVARELDMGVEEVSASIVRIANSMMSKILHIVSVERGFDPRKFSLVAFGGAGPMHACALAEALDVRDVMVPPSPGMFSAFGLLTADIFHDYARSVVVDSSGLDEEEAEELYIQMEGEGRAALEAEGVEPQAMVFRRQMDLRYMGQSYELTVDLPSDGGGFGGCVEAFHLRHEEIYGYSAPGEPVEVVNLGLRAIGKIPKPSLAGLRHVSGAPTPSMRRLAYFEGPHLWVETPVYRRDALGPGVELQGPAIVEQYDATTVVYPDWGVSVDDYGVMRMRRDLR
jgi:N-methylhydantoinase A